jgi:TonB family protein
MRRPLIALSAFLALSLHIAAAQTEDDPPPLVKYHDALLKLWSDRPDYVALISQNVKPGQLLSTTNRTQPRVNPCRRIQVVVSFVVGINGAVDAARVVVSTDSTFNKFALDEIRDFKFKPAEGPGGPSLAVGVAPMIFHC